MAEYVQQARNGRTDTSGHSSAAIGFRAMLAPERLPAVTIHRDRWAGFEPRAQILPIAQLRRSLNESPRVAHLARISALLQAKPAPEASARVSKTTCRTGPSSSAVIQRYHDASSNDYQIQRDDQETQAMFTMQTPNPVLADVGDPIVEYPQYQFEPKPTDARPDLFAADDDTVAVQKVGEPKEFYATDQVLQNANGALGARNSAFRLASKGHQLTIQQHTLKIVGPKLSVPNVQAEADTFGKYFSSICRNFATKVMDSTVVKHEALFQSASSPGVADVNAPKHRREIDTGDSVNSTKMRNLAKSLTITDAPGALRDAFETADTREDDTTVGQDYGTASRGAGFRDKAKALGVNEYAAPEVGEGFATYSTPVAVDLAGAMLDYAAGVLPVSRPKVWGYHYAGVVATSQDGKDRITLENYNRADDIDAKLGEVFDRLFDDHRDAIMVSLREYLSAMPFEQLPPSTIQDAAYKTAHMAANAVQPNLQQKTQEANASYRRLVSARNDNQAWFFQIYGTNQGQTFHERQAASTFFANPMTARVGKISEGVIAIDALRTTLNNKLNQIPPVAANVADLAVYAGTLDTARRQVLSRTTSAEIKMVFNDALQTLTQYRVRAHVEEATNLAAAEGIENVDGYSARALARLIVKMQKKRSDLSFWDFSAKSGLDARILGLQTLDTKVGALTQYHAGNVQP